MSVKVDEFRVWPKRFSRFVTFLAQRCIRGWDDSDTWSLDYSLAKNIAPRLKKFKEASCGQYPSSLTEDEWLSILDKMINSFEFLASEKRWDCFDDVTWTEVQEGLDLFAKYYTNLWW